MGTKAPALAIDIGGTKIAVGLVEPDGRLLTWAQIPTPRLDAEQLWRTLDSLISRAIAEAHVEAPELAGVGCGCGGPASARGPPGAAAAPPKHANQATRRIWIAYGLMGSLLAGYFGHLVFRRPGQSSEFIDGWGVATFEIVGALLTPRRRRVP